MIRVAGAVLSMVMLLPGQAVRIVDSAAGGAGALQAGVNASSAGDILRVRPGTYTPTTIRFGLHILCEPNADCHQVIAQGIPVGETLTMVGLNLVGIPGTDNRLDHAPLRVEKCLGKVVYVAGNIRGRQDKVLQPMGFPSLPSAAPAVRVESADLHLVDATLTGVDGGATVTYGPPSYSYFFWIGCPALTAVGAQVTLSGCTLSGGRGGSWAYWSFGCPTMNGGNGAQALTTEASLVVIDRSVLRGGIGGNAQVLVQCNYCATTVPTPGLGGSAVLASKGGTLVCMGPSHLSSGTAGTSPCFPSTPAPAIEGDSGFQVFMDPAVTLVPGAGAPPIRGTSLVTTRAMASMESQAVRATLGTPVGWTHHDQPGAFAFFLLSPGTANWLPHPFVLGGVHLDPTALFMLGPLAVPASGTLTFAFTVPTDPSLRGGRFYVQTLGIDSSLQLTGPPLRALCLEF